MIHLTYDVKWHWNEMFFKNFLEMVLVLIPRHNVHQMYIFQVLLMIKLMVFEEQSEEYDLLIIKVLELFEIVLLEHKIQHNLMKYEIIIYYVHVIMHVQQLNLVLFKRIIKYELKGLKMNKTVQSLHIITTELIFVILKKEKEKERRKQ